jgi:hypothetical protein
MRVFAREKTSQGKLTVIQNQDALPFDFLPITGVVSHQSAVFKSQKRELNRSP